MLNTPFNSPRKAKKIDTDTMYGLLGLLSDAIWDFDNEHHSFYWSDNFLTMLEYEDGEIEPSLDNWKNLIYEDDLYGIELLLQACIDNKQDDYNYEARFKTKNNTLKWIQIKGKVTNRDKLGYVERMLGTFTDITERKKAELSLVEDRIHYTHLFDNITNGVAIYEALDGGEDFIIMDINKAGEKLSNVKRENIIGKNVTSVFPGVKDIGLFDVFKKVYKTGKPEKLPLSLYKDARMEEWVENYVFKLPSGLIVAIYEDTTEIRVTGMALSEIEQNFRHLAEESPNMIFINQNGKIVFANKACEEITQYKKEEFYDDSFDFMVLIADESADQIIENFKKHQAGNDIPPYDYKLIKKDGTQIDTIINTKLVTYNKERAILGIITDISKRKKAETELKKSEWRFRKMIEQNPIPMAVTDANQDIILFNSKFTETFGYTIEDVPTAEIWWESVYPDLNYREQVKKEWNEAVIEAMKTGSEIEKQVWEITCKDKSKRIVEFYFVSLGDFNVLSLIDITEKQRIENEMLKALEKAEESDRLKSAFLANMSHEIRTPMNGIIGFADMLKSKDLTSSKKKHFIEIITESSKRLLHIVNDIIDISKIEVGQIEINESKVSLNDLLVELLLFYKPAVNRNNLNIYLHKPLNDLESTILADGTKLHQVLHNLLSNALKYTKQGHITFGYQVHDSSIEFYVEDTGTGISKDKHELIFKRFRKANEEDGFVKEGTGLGLSISKAYVEKMGGKIWLKSKKDKGTTFYFTIPYKKYKETINITSKSTKKAYKMSGKVVLVVEDEEINYLYLEEILNNMGVNVLHAQSGNEAIKIVKSNPEISLVLMDIKLPDIDGLKVTKKIKAFRKDLPVIAQTAYALSADRELALDAGCEDYIAKPIKVEDFIEMIENYA